MVATMLRKIRLILFGPTKKELRQERKEISRNITNMLKQVSEETEAKIYVIRK